MAQGRSPARRSRAYVVLTRHGLAVWGGRGAMLTRDGLATALGAPLPHRTGT